MSEWTFFTEVLKAAGFDAKSFDGCDEQAVVSEIRNKIQWYEDHKAKLGRHLRRAVSDRDSLIVSINSYTEMGTKVFADTKAIAEQALGRPIESGHTAVYAAELLAEELAKVRAERDSFRDENQRLRELEARHHETFKIAVYHQDRAEKAESERDKLAREVRLLRTELHTLGNELTKEYSDRDKWHAARPHLRQMGYDALAFGKPEAIHVTDDEGATT